MSEQPTDKLEALNVAIKRLKDALADANPEWAAKHQTTDELWSEVWRYAKQKAGNDMAEIICHEWDDGTVVAVLKIEGKHYLDRGTIGRGLSLHEALTALLEKCRVWGL